MMRMDVEAFEELWEVGKGKAEQELEEESENKAAFSRLGETESKSTIQDPDRTMSHFERTQRRIEEAAREDVRGGVGGVAAMDLGFEGIAATRTDVFLLSHNADHHTNSGGRDQSTPFDHPSSPPVPMAASSPGRLAETVSAAPPKTTAISNVVRLVIASEQDDDEDFGDFDAKDEVEEEKEQEEKEEEGEEGEE
eukprot:CAMPEP_0175062880 /NCGR_PEP_ID=MMETSP0052_2-20121109/14422_1 /TAXON_ID=51329 ORGANISM="Polytomella parva, Strain SAG 63-3" /NCGR_SAMPLE_ID=MMETSP0052_2 /ASSEMBLY_ACC=CAM_ASM_000194 /LENGTH=194 /DNA_ID=CAMNT_0016328967 /DNA_START=462 /DNA_END=1043 /DNA_ORIENTATION=-